MISETKSESTTSGSALDVELDILGQQPFLRIYTQISFCFPVPDSSVYPTCISTLEKGLGRLSASFPWVAGQVINENASEGNTGVFKIKAFEKTPRLIVKDLRNDSSAPTMEDLRISGFPISMLDENVIAPRRTLPGGPDYNPTDPEPVVILQANLIEGGLILTVNGQHGAMDMTGQGEVIRLLSKACRGEAFAFEELTAGNLNRKTAIPLLDEPFNPGEELADQIIQPPPPQVPSLDSKPSPPPAPPKATWAYFSFSHKSLSALKSYAKQSVNGATNFISTDDALSAFIWQSVTRARLPRLDPADKTRFCRAVDARGCIGAPKKYPGILQNMTYNTNTAQQLVDEPLGITASKLRSELDPSKLRRRTQALATYLNSVPDKSTFNFAATVNPAADVMLSSWAKVNCYDFDFNFELGKPESVRRPRFDPFECLMYLMPKSRDGEISLAISLREEDMERLKEDEKFIRYGRYIG
ncbi:transferase family-domain-containing protein [Dactylonectria macrodidyma]|uniref:Transferase family-domain-containing protein n=1 Tax=Dactylonectria macrodidyma TaxID=307937 RepID=A0A9P9DLN2_9HYPO|nr:transferase family-domain-containing protein [Dactylonectria macrodidyma]